MIAQLSYLGNGIDRTDNDWVKDVDVEHEGSLLGSVFTHTLVARGLACQES